VNNLPEIALNNASAGIEPDISNRKSNVLKAKIYCILTQYSATSRIRQLQPGFVSHTERAYSL